MERTKIINLPVIIDPMVRCYRIHAYMSSIIECANPNFRTYMLSNYLCLHNGKEGVRRDYLDFHLENNFISMIELFRDNSWFDIVQVQDFNAENYRKKNEIRDLIVYFIENGYYLLQKVNEGSLPHSSKYGAESEDNTSMLHGFDWDKKVFYMLDYKKNGSFASSSVRVDDYLNALSSVRMSNRLNFIKAKAELNFEFDNIRARNLLACHIQSKTAYPDHNEYSNNIFGYESVERTLKGFQSNGLSMIRLRAIKEHKDMILRYMQYVFKNNYVDTQEYYDRYRDISSKMDMIFMKILKKSIIGGSGKIYCEEIDRIRRLNECECVLIDEYLKES